MKNKLLLSKILTLVIVLISVSALAQIPQKMSYQAVVRDSDNKIVAGSNVGVRISILKGAVPVYVETHLIQSNENGLISLEIGGGNTNDDFSAIQWFDGIFYLKTEFDIAGGTSYQISGTSQLLSVPYALHSKTSESIPEGQNVGDMLYWDGTKWAILPVGNDRTALILCNGIPSWGGCDEDGEPILIVDNRYGDEVLAVYGSGVVVNIPYSDGQKSGRGGFAVGGFTTEKEGFQDFLLVTTDSVRVYVKDDSPDRSGRGGFAVGGFTSEKDIMADDYFRVTNDSIFVSTPLIAEGNIQITGDLNIGGNIINKPIVSTNDAYIEDFVTVHANIIDDGGGEIIEIGFYYGLSATQNSNWVKHIVDLIYLSDGFFFATIEFSDLLPETTYYIRAFARNSAGFGVGEILSFETPEGQGPGTVVDEDNNVYQTLFIGGNRWMVENLRTTKYNDGFPITTGLNNTEWMEASTGAYSIYPHESIFPTQDEMMQAYGVLYNWFTIETNMLCPIGWRVPTLSDWNMLLYAVGGPGVAGRELKSTRTEPELHPRWNAGNIATNSVDFSTLPAGYRNFEGLYFGLGSSATYWAADDIGSTETFALNFAFNFIDIAQQIFLKTSGYSVRCVKNNK
ncbi:MAG: fibrobacter succinogenes major paralogous domain-containing protein [Bacteroidetes bacterium]|nr:fibrobacter succinogenes major paralogous domain-containing protein [Bacteroidota bacterium]